MPLLFDIDRVRTTEFGIGRQLADGQVFRFVPVDLLVQETLREMVGATWRTIEDQEDSGPYDPGEKYSSIEYVHIPIDHELAEMIRQLHAAANLEVDPNPLQGTENIFCYFVRMVDEDNQRITGVRRATQFKGVLKKRLLSWGTDALRMVTGRIFALDHDFDFLVDDETVHIMRPSGFESTGQLQEAILAAVPRNVGEIQDQMSFIDFAPIQRYAETHPRAARYLASIRNQDLANINRENLSLLCRNTGVLIQEVDGNLVIQDDQVLGFLEVLDRRRYEIELIADAPERYRAPRRLRLSGN